MIFCNVSNRLDLILYADDTCVFMSNTDIEVLQQLASELHKLAHSLEVNKLVLNINERNYIIFSNKTCINSDSVSIKDK